MVVRDLAKMIDHSLLQPFLTAEDIKNGCETAKKWDTATVCVRPCDVLFAVGLLAGTDIKVSTVIGFPHGSHTTGAKLFETKEAIEAGAKELDMVLNIGKLRTGDYDYVENDIKTVVEYAHSKQVIVKVILENAYLSDEQKIAACGICTRVGADFVKTSTGYAPSGAVPEDLKLMRQNCPPNVQVKAAGGIRTLGALMACRAVGCTRVGATATEAILAEAEKHEKNGTLTENLSESLDEGY